MPRLDNRPVLDPMALNKEIAVEEIKAAIHANSDNKSPGTDDITLNQLSSRMAHVLDSSMRYATTASK